MGRATGLLLVILGVWLVIATLAGRLPERILSLTFPATVPGTGGTFTGETPGAVDPDRPGGGGGAW